MGISFAPRKFKEKVFKRDPQFRQNWIHDSNHGYRWQSFEYEVANNALAVGAILVSDDVDASMAWGLMDKSSFGFTAVVFDARKMFGIAQKSTTQF